MMKSSIKYCIAVLLVISLFFSCSFSAFAAKGNYDWGQWLEEDKKSELKDDMTFEEMKAIAENERFELKLNDSNGVFAVYDKQTDSIWQSNQANWQSESKISGTAKEALNAQLQIKCYNKKDRQFISLNSYSHSCAKDGYSYKKCKNGFSATYKFTDYDITVGIDVVLTKDGISASIKKKNFSDTEAVRVHEIALLPYFLSANENDSGYIFVPDGSGAVISLNKSVGDTTEYSSRVYGKSLSYNTNLSKAVEVLLPVYGIQKNGAACLAVIEKGDALAEIKASVKGQVNNTNTVYTSFILRDYYFYSAGAYGASEFDVFEKGEIKQEEYKIAYSFLKKGKTEYYDMANTFKEKYLKSVKSDRNYTAIVDVLAATRKTKSFLGVPVTQTEVMTSSDELSKILADFEKNGIKDLAVRYNGVSDSELKYKVYDSLKIDSKVGSIEKIDKVASSQKKIGNKLYITYNPVQFVKGFFTSSKNISRDLLGQYITIEPYRVSGVKDDDGKKTVLLMPNSFLEKTEKLSKSVKDNSFGLSPTVITTRFYSDYSKHSGNAQYTVEKFSEGLSEIKKNNGLMTDSATYYALFYSQVNTNAPKSSSEYDLFDSSVPFYEIALSGKLTFSYASLNLSADNNAEYLKCIETGAVPKYSFYWRDKSLLRDSIDTDWYSGNFNEWKKEAFNQIEEYKKFSEKVGNREIVSHKKLADGVYETLYKSGVTAIVNYTNADYTYNNNTVSAEDYLLLEKGVIE